MNDNTDSRKFSLECPGGEVDITFTGDYDTTEMLVDILRRGLSLKNREAHWQIGCDSINFYEIVPDNDEIVEITCYGQTVKMKRGDAIRKYSDGVASCEGSERDRYLKILLALQDGKMKCSDES